MVMGNCLKCGNAITEKAAFCDQCVQVMEQYPVKPGSIAHLLPRPQRPERKTPDTYRESIEKTKLKGMRRTIRWLVALTLILSALLLLTAGMLLHSIDEPPEAPAIGRNYTTTKTP